MNCKKFIIPVSIIISGCMTLFFCENTASNTIIKTNVEALANNEGAVIENLSMSIWWVNESDGGKSIICTLGGNEACK